MACDQTEWTFHEGQLGEADVRALLAHHFAEMRADSPPEACHVLPPDRLAEPGLRLFVLRDGDGALLGVGALKAIEPGHGEVKSMRTSPEALGRGVGRDMLERLIDAARAMGMSRLSLETGNSALFDPANRLPRPRLRAVPAVRGLSANRVHAFLHQGGLSRLASRATPC